MARLIPSAMDDRTPPGERDVYNLLAAGPDDWVVLHSLDLAPWNHGLRTEIDFVVLIPEAGILCIEVKSHDNIAFDGNRWSPGTIIRSPFKQASDGSHSFHRRLAELVPRFRWVPVVHCCIFPRASFDLPPNLSVQPWELMDLRVFRSFRTGCAFCADLKERVDQSVRADARVQPLAHRLSRGDIDAMVQHCLPVQRYHPDARQEIVWREEEIARTLREPQKTVLQLAALNRRLVVSGGAGTGKTLIAMEVARRLAEGGRRVALLCFNQLVGTWMERRMSEGKPALPNLVVGRAIRVMAEMMGIGIPERPPRSYWDVNFPQELEERLTDPDSNATALFDYLVLDEAQDLLARPRLWQCLSHFLSGGAARGNIALFGDFDHQALTEQGELRRALSALDEIDRPVRWVLSENCRNYRIVGDTAVRLAGFQTPVYSGFLRAGGGVHNYDIFFFRNEQEQLDRLAQWLRDFRAQGYKPCEISVLSFRTDYSSAARRLENAGFALRPAWQAGDFTSYASVHAFKGMENKIVLLTDVALRGPGFQRDLFYTGMTRATESVRVLCEQGSQAPLHRWLSGKDSA